MALSVSLLLKIKVDYESGKFTKSFICKKHKVSQPTLRKQAKANGWKFQKNFQEVSKIVELKTIERLIENEVDKAAQLNDKFLTNVSEIENLVLGYLGELNIKKTKAPITGTPKKEGDRIFTLLKSCKISSEILNMNYSSARKMLGMDKEADIEKARRIKEGGADANTSITITRDEDV